MQTCIHMSNHVSCSCVWYCTLSHVCILYKWFSFFLILYCKYCIEYSSIVSINPKMSQSVSSGDVSGDTVIFKLLYYKIKNVYFLCLFSMYICVKSIVNLVQYYLADCVTWVPRLILLDLKACS